MNSREFKATVKKAFTPRDWKFKKYPTPLSFEASWHKIIDGLLVGDDGVWRISVNWFASRGWSVTFGFGKNEFTTPYFGLLSEAMSDVVPCIERAKDSIMATFANSASNGAE